MAYCGYVTYLKNVREHPNADKMKLADCFENTICVGLDAKENDIVIYFPTDGQLSQEYCTQNNLVRKKDESGVNIGGYLDPEKRNITAIRLRGEKSDGISMPLESLAYTGIDLADLTVGTQITVVNGHEICCKYIPKSNTCAAGAKAGNKTRKHSAPIAPLFAEHADTEQLAYNLDAFRSGDEIEITLKMHGTSQRTGYLPVLKGYKRTILDKILRREGTPIYDWGYVSGTRRTVLEDFDGGYYGSNEFRETHSKFFEGKLNKGEEIFYEVVGFTHTGAPIMASGDNKKLNDKDFVKRYGQTTTFSYGCNPEGGEEGHYEDIVWVAPQSEIYVYRMTMTNEDNFTVEYSPDFMRYRCEQMGVKCVPVMWKGVIPEIENDENLPEEAQETAGSYIKNIAEQFYDGPDPVGKTHIREGVVVRIVNRSKFTAYKHKNFLFKQITGIISNAIADSNVEVDADIAAEL